MNRAAPRSPPASGAAHRRGRFDRAAATVAPVLAGATAAAAGVMLLGWPHRPPLPGQAGAVAAVTLVVVAVLLVFAPPCGRG